MKFIIETYGCQMNVADSELITTILTDDGFVVVDDISEAQIIIFNTCSVRDNAEQRVIGRISNEVSRKAQNKDLLIGIVGCMAQRLGEELKKINKKIDFIVGVDQYKSLPEVIREQGSGIRCQVSGIRYKVSGVKNKKSPPTPLYKEGSFIELNSEELYDQIFPTRSNSLNAFVTIMRGCNNYCSYCIVPYVRGRERSRSVNEILNEIELAKIHDITLLGQNVNSFNYKGIDFPDLLKKVNEIESVRRIRFITSHPKDLSDKLIETMSLCEKVCEHIHLPMQSGNSDVLGKMNRGYTAEHYFESINKLRVAMPNIAITTDVIAGFPGETEVQFNDTMEMMKTIQFDFAFMFKYSERSGTKACEFTDSVPEEVRLNRLQRLIDMQTEITTQKYKARIGAVEEIYVECISKRDSSEMSGKTKDFKITVFKGDESLVGQFIKVKIVDAVGWTLKGIRV